MLSWVCVQVNHNNIFILKALPIKGHSERRTLFHETSQDVALKTQAALSATLSVILCIGETLEQREAGKTTEVCEEQLQAVVDILKESDWR
jgi:triosephosphate isomerase